MIRIFLFLICIYTGSFAQKAQPNDFYLRFPLPEGKSGDAIKKKAFQKKEVVAIYSCDSANSCKYGLMNKSGQITVPLLYDTLFSIDGSTVAVGKNTKGAAPSYSLLKFSGRSVSNHQYDTIQRISEGVFFLSRKNITDIYFSKSSKLESELSITEYLSFSGLILACRNFAYGLYDSDGGLVAEFRYKKIENINDISFRIHPFPQWTVTDNSVCTADSITPVSSSKYIYFRNMKAGLFTPPDNYSPAIYDSIIPIGDYFIIINNQSKGVMSYDGTILIDSKYDHVSISGSKAILCKNDWCGVLDLTANKFFVAKYQAAKFIGRSHIAFKDKTDLWGLATLSGDVAIPSKYDSIGGMINDHIEASYQKSWGLIDIQGNWIICPGDLQAYKVGLLQLEKNSLKCKVNTFRYNDLFSLGNGYVKARLRSKFGVLNQEGKEIVPCIYDQIDLVDTIGLFAVRNGNKVALLDYNNEFIFSFKDDVTDISQFSCGMAMFKKAGQYGYMDQNGNVRIAPKYVNALAFSDSMAAVKINEKWGYVDRDEQIIIQPNYREAGRFKNGVAIVSREQGKYSFINKNEKDVNGTIYNSVIKLENGKYKLVKNGKSGLADEKGKEIVVPRYEQILELGNGNYIVKREGKYGVINSNQDFVIPIEKDKIIYNKYSDKFHVMVSGETEMLNWKMKEVKK